MLADEERAELGRLVGNGYLTRVGTRSLIEHVESIITARVRAARAQELRDAADDVDLSRFYDPNPLGQVSQECGHAETAVHQWLRDRANHIESSNDG